MFDLQIPIFPFDSTAITLTTAVWVGVCVTVFFNVRLGWTLSGLVVPGYLAPLLITRPVTASVIMFEAILTYLIVRAISSGPRLQAYWSGFFGRDRFFLIVVVSVLVRALFDGWLLPQIGQFMVDNTEISFNYRENLRSFGLIVVALIANYFWKPGLRKGILPIMTTITITYLLVQYFLVGVTNFNVGNMHLLYEDISTSLMASPKAYMIVITTAFLASWINLRYAWDFNGILIPALLGLLWYDPSKILVSAVECLIIYGVGCWLIKTPVFRTMTIEGGLKLIYFFTICFVFRMLLCHLLPLFIPGVSLTDSFGFGYLLTTLMAIKAYDKKLLIRMLNATGQVSVLGAVAGSLIGFLFIIGPRIGLPRVMADAGLPAAVAEAQPQSLTENVRRDKVQIYKQRLPESYQPPLPRELSLFESTLRQLKALKKFDQSAIALARHNLTGLQYELHCIDDRYLYLREAAESRGWGIFVIDLQGRGGLSVEVPSPLDEGITVEAGLQIFQQFPSRTLAIAGSPRQTNALTDTVVLQTSNTMYGTFHKVFGDHIPFVVRGFTAKFAGKMDKLGLNRTESQMWIRRQIPPQLELNKLQSMIGSFGVNWNSSPTRNLLRESSNGPFVELFLNPNDQRKLVGYQRDGDLANLESQNVQVNDCHLSQWLQEAKDRILQQGTDSYTPPAVEELLYLDEEVIKPLVDVIKHVNKSGKPDMLWTRETVALQLSTIQAAARVLGYEVHLIRDEQASAVYLALAEREGGSFKGWGTFVFKVGESRNYAVEVPRPLYEFRSFDFGKNLFARTNAAALLVAGAHPRANRDSSSDMSKAINRINMYNLVRHVLFRQQKDNPFLIVQARAIQAPVDADVVVATDEGSRSKAGLSPLKLELLQYLEDDRMKLAFVDGSENTAGYEIGILLQATAVQVSANKEVISLWLSPSLRSKFREQLETDGLAAQFAACQIAKSDKPLWERINAIITRDNAADGHAVRGTQLPVTLRSGLEEYARTFDVLKLRSLVDNYPAWQFEELLDESSAQVFLLVLRKDSNDIPAVMNLTGFVGTHAMTCAFPTKDVIDTFVRSRALWLEVESK